MFGNSAPVLPKATTGVNNIHGMPPPQNQNTVAPEPAHISPPTNQVNMISTNSPVLPLGVFVFLLDVVLLTLLSCHQNGVSLPLGPLF
jgi:hypothetical protein